MTLVSAATELTRRSAAAAERALCRAGVTVDELRSPAQIARAAELLRQVWRGTGPPVPANLLRAVQHTGGYVFGAYEADEDDRLVAVSMALLATEGLHSHITGVVPAVQRRGVGFALKQHQRAWALHHGLVTITWTCDPLVRRNLSFNLHALRATVEGYLPNHYGAMNDGLNGGDETDRFELYWNLDSPAVMLAGDERLPWIEAGGLPVAVAADARGLPVVRPVTGPARLVHLPSDIEALRRTDASAGLAWRRAVREAVVPALAEGAVVRGLTAAGELVLDVPS
jgi:predicted GNAT superfamily acetyltransferase